MTTNALSKQIDKLILCKNISQDPFLKMGHLRPFFWKFAFSAFI